MNPKGTLLIIGGAEDTGEVTSNNANKNLPRNEILREILSCSRNKKIAIITTGSQVQEQVKKKYKQAFRRIDYPNPEFVPIKTREQANHARYINKVKEAGAVFFTGGDQFRLLTILGGTKILNLIKKRYFEEKCFLVAGTSAGAMIMSSVMIYAGGTREALFENDLKIASGFGFLRNCIIDTHFIKRGRFGRLAHAVIINPNSLGIGLGEDTALIIKKGCDAECRGSGMVVIIDGKKINQTNVVGSKEMEPVYVENLVVHLLVKGCRFSIKTCKLNSPAIKRRKK